MALDSLHGPVAVALQPDEYIEDETEAIAPQATTVLEYSNVTSLERRLHRGLHVLETLLGTSPALALATLILYVPDRDREGALIRGHAHWVDRAMCILDSLEPGCSTQLATGMWRGSREQTAIVLKDVREDFFDRDLSPLLSFLEEFCALTRQELVYVALVVHGRKWVFSFTGSGDREKSVLP